MTKTLFFSKFENLEFLGLVLTNSEEIGISAKNLEFLKIKGKSDFFLDLYINFNTTFCDHKTGGFTYKNDKCLIYFYI